GFRAGRCGRQAARRVRAAAGAGARHADAEAGQDPPLQGVPCHLRQLRVQPPAAPPLPRRWRTRRNQGVSLRHHTGRPPAVRRRCHAGRAVPLPLHQGDLPPALQEPPCRAQRLHRVAAGHVHRRRQRHELHRRRRTGHWRAVCAVLDCQRLRLLGLPPLPHLVRQGHLPTQSTSCEHAAAEQLTNGYLDTPVDWTAGMSKHMRLKDFPNFIWSTDPDEYMAHFALHVTERLAEADAAIFNTLEELEPAALDAVRAMLPPTVPVYTIGHLPLLAEEIVPQGGTLDALGSNLWKEDVSCFDFLDGKEPRSVVYVNYGSITVMSNEELLEFAWGLANSGQPFLWIIRPDLVKGDAAVLPPEFLESIEGRGVLASWCPQEAVLRHEAVGVFLTHSGWNSTVESLCGGVPTLCWPFFAEQQTNSRYSCVEWGVAMEIGHDVRREAVEAKIREAMSGEKGKEMRRRAEEWREAGVRATRPGGRSRANLEKLVADSLLSGGKPRD
uniref:Glycosyltransferase n=2 Tax=Aegilops tauschii subsp. strangulata TaxID=200361 RepID=A0A453C3I1_AEGTS